MTSKFHPAEILCNCYTVFRTHTFIICQHTNTHIPRYNQQILLVNLITSHETHKELKEELHCNMTHKHEDYITGV